MSQNISQDFRPHTKRRVKDSLVLILIFCIGLAGLCYILQVSASKGDSTGYFHHDTQGNAGEVIYFTSSK